MQYRGGVDFEDEGRVRFEKKPASGLLFRGLKKLHLAKTDTGASFWVFGILVIIVIIWVRVLMNVPRTVTIDRDAPKSTNQTFDYNKLESIRP